MIAGISLGLGSALAHSLAYICSRVFIIRRHQGVLRLMALAHVIMGVISAALLPLLWSDDVPAISSFIWPLLGWLTCYMTGQAALFFALRRTDASRISPLLAMKIVILAMITVTALGGSLTMLQWTGVLAAVVAAFVLNYAGGRLATASMAAVGLACVVYALADLSIVRLIAALGTLGKLHASAFGTCMGMVICGAVGLALMAGAGMGAMKDLPYALPFAVSWLVGVALIFACFALVGAILGNILQSTRGLFSIIIGAQLARLGMVHIEQPSSRPVLLRRLAAAAMMILAITLYSIG